MNLIPGLTQDELGLIKNILKKVLSNEFQTYAFGSRVNGAFRKNSDLDLLIESELPMAFSEISKLNELFEESNLPFKIDLIESSRVSDSILKNIQSQKRVQIYP